MDRLALKDPSGRSAGSCYVRLLGHPAGERDGRPLNGLERNPKKLGVLAYLAVQPAQKFVTREALLAVFWSESPEKPARHALSQTLHFFRQHLGNDALLTSGPNLLKLNPAIVRVDVREFEAALDSRNVEAACALYRGDLLEGLSLQSDAADWLDRERHRLRVRAAEAFWRHSTSALRAGIAETATQNAQRAIECDPTAERECSEFIDAAVEAKQFGVAHAVALFFAAALEQASGGDSPSAAFLTRMRELGDMRVEPPAPPAPAPPEPARDAVVRPATPPRQRANVLRNVLGAAGAFAVLAFVVRYMIVKPGLASPGPPPVLQLVIREAATPEKELELLVKSVSDVVGDDFNRIGWRIFTPATKTSAGLVAGYSLELRALRSDTGIVFTYRLSDPVSEAVIVPGVLATGAKPDVSTAGHAIADSIRAGIGRKQPVIGSLSDRENADLQNAFSRTALAESFLDSGSLEEAARAFEVADSVFAATKWTDRTRLIAGVRRVKQFEKWGMVERYLGDHAKKDSVMARAERVASDLVKRYKRRPEPLEARSSMRMVRTFLSTAPSAKMLDSVETDLRALIRRHQGSASTFARLSAVLEYEGELTESRAMAEAAASRDDYLVHDKDIRFRQFRLAFDLDEDESAERYCASLERRYPDETPSSVCRLLLMGWSEASTPDTALALRIVRTGAVDDPDGMRKLTIPRLQGLSAAVYTRVGQTERARAILRNLEASGDPELLHIRAAVLALLGDLQDARALARQFAAQNEINERAIGHGRIYRGLLDNSTH